MVWEKKLKKISFIGILILTVVFCPAGVLAAQSSDGDTGGHEKVVRVGYFPFMGYHMIDENGHKNGYGYEYLQKIRNYTGWKYDYIGDDEEYYWADMIPMLENGEIDLLTSVSKSEDMMDKLDFSDYSIGTKSTILTIRAGNNSYTAENPSDWDGMRIGLLRDNNQSHALSEFAQKNGFSYEAVYLGSSAELAQCLQDGTVDAVISSDLRKIENEWILAKFNPEPYYVVVKKGNTELMAQVNDALEKIKDASPDLENQLYQKYYTPSNGEQIYYTPKEREYIRQMNEGGTVLKAVMNPDMYPYCYFEDGTAKGICADIANEIFSRTKLNIEIVEVKDNLSYWEMINSGSADIVLDAFNNYTMAEKYGYLLGDPYYNISLSILSLGNKNINDSKKIALVEDGSFMKDFLLTDKLKDSEVMIFDDTASCVRAVEDKKAEIAVLYTYCAQGVVENDVKNRFTSTKVPVISASFSVAVQEQQNSNLNSILNKASNSLGSKMITDLTEPYLDLNDGEESFIEFIYDNPVWFAVTVLSFILVLAMVIVVRITIKNKNHIRALNQNLNKALADAEKANGAKTQFLAQMSHEIRTPMNAIIGFTAIAREGTNSPGQIREYLSKIENSSRLLLGIINDILDMSAIEGGKIKIAKASFDFKKQISEITAMFYQQAKQKNIKMDIYIKGITEEIVVGDELRLNQILMNLLSNALKFTPSGGQIRLSVLQASCSMDKVHMRFVISDTGCGMSDDMLRRLFRPFEQQDSSTARKYGGSGLGLSITKRLVEMMGGSIQVKSKLNVGTEFTVDIPFDTCAQPELGDMDQLTDIRTLVVDDDPEACEYTGILLERLRVRYDTVLSGEEALNMLGEAEENGDPYKLCIIDWRMPSMDGSEVTQKIREIFGDDTIIIIISAYDLNELERDGKTAGANYLIPKPLFQSTIFNALMQISGGNGIYMRKEPKNPDNHFDFSGRRVLIAEDVALNMEVAIKLLKAVGIEVYCAEDGRQALEMYEKSQDGMYDCILLDINMPVMDGYEAARGIRSSSKPDAGTIPIYAMTANAFAEDVTAALDAGMNGHIAKPIDTNTLYQTLERAFRGEEYEPL